MIEQITIGGIVRNTTKQNSLNGSMEEIVNLRWRDGNIEPMPAEQEIWKALGNTLKDDIKLFDCFSQLFIHNCNDYKHLLGICVKDITVGNQQLQVSNAVTPYSVCYIGDIVDSTEIGDDGNPVPNVTVRDNWYYDTIIKVDSKEAVVHNVGNLLTIHSDKKLQHILWSNGKYHDVTINWSGSQWDTEVAPDYHIQLRSIPRCDKEGNPLLYASGASLGEGHSWSNYKSKDQVTSNGAASIAQARALAKEVGMLNGYAIAITALELYDGSFVCASRPVLIPKALAGEEEDRSVYEEMSSYKFRINNNYKTKMFSNPNTETESQGQGTFFFETTYQNTRFKRTSESNQHTLSFTAPVTPVKSAFVEMGATGSTDLAVGNVNKINELMFTRVDSKDGCWGIITGNDLQVKFPKELKDSRLSDIIKSVSVFITDEEPESETYNEVKSYTWSDSSNTGGARVWLENTEESKVIDRLAAKSVFYEVYNRNISDIETDKWITVDLSEKLNVLEQQKFLPVDSSTTRTTILPGTSYLYNGRLHVADIQQDTFKGFPLKYFEMSDAWDTHYAQRMTESFPGNVSASYNAAYDTSELWRGWKREAISLSPDTQYTYVIAHIETPEGWQKVGKIEKVRTDSSYYKLNPILYYPDSRCKLLQIGTIEYTDNAYVSHCTFFKMGTFKAVEGAVHVELNPIDWYDNTVEVSCPDSPEAIYNQIINNTTSEEYTDLNFTCNSASDWAMRTTHRDSDGAAIVTFNATGYITRQYIGDYSNDPSTAMSVGATGWNLEYSYYHEPASGYGAEVRYKKGNKTLTIYLDTTHKWEDGEAPIHCWCIRKMELIIPYTDTIDDYSFTLDLNKESISDFAEPYTFTNKHNRSSNDTKRAFVVSGNSINEIVTFENGEVAGLQEKRTVIDRPNVLKVSATQTPMYFPANYTYQVGNGQVRGLCANTTAVSTGQCGSMPLMVFCSDGIYGFFVDQTGQLVYSACRPISREVCNNSKSITPVDDAVVFSSERGLMTIAGAEVTELSQPIEGRVLKFATANTHPDRLDSAKLIIGTSDLDKLAWLNMPNMPTSEEAKEYLKNAQIGYNYDNKELWVANPSKEYVYIFAEGRWSKAVRKVAYFVNDYPSTYAVWDSSKIVDLARSTQDVTECFFLTRPIVISGENAKHFTEAWLYGDFNVFDNSEDIEEYIESLSETTPQELKDKIAKLTPHKASIFVYGSADGARYSMLGVGGVQGCTRNIIAKVHRMSLRYLRIMFAARLYPDSRIESLMVDWKPAYGETSTIKPR